MSRSFVTSDHHFYHENIIKYTGRPFARVEEMHEVMIRCWKEVVGPADLVWHLGDFCMSGHLDDMRRILGQLNGEKILIVGNHDTYKKAEYLNAGFKEVYAHPIIIHRVLMLSHEPLAMSEDMPYYNLHGHTHDQDMLANENKRRNVSVEKTGFYPVNLGKIRNEVLKKMKEKPVKNASPDQKKLFGKNVVKNRETISDDYPELTQKDFDRAVKRNGLKPISEAKENPFDVLAKQAKQESQAGTTVTLEDFERQMKKRVSQKSAEKQMPGKMRI